MVEFLGKWNYITQSLPPSMDQESILDQLIQETRKSKVLEPDLAMFDRLPLDSEQRNCSFILVAIENHIEREREDQERQTGYP